MSRQEFKTECSHCGENYNLEDNDNCPKCGHTVYDDKIEEVLEDFNEE